MYNGLNYILSMASFLNSRTFLLYQNSEHAYYTEMSKELSNIVIFINVISAFHLLVVVPMNVFTLVVITKTKSLWTPSNIVLCVNGFFMTIGSLVMLVGRLSSFPLLFFDEDQRVVLYSVVWWNFTLTIRIGNNRLK